VSTTPYDDHLHVRPFWTVQPVYDPDGTGGDFAYTIGLAERGLPELHLYCRPSLGEDPGEDWMFSCRDSVSVLNELAVMWVRGELGVGSTLRREYDGGLSVVDFRVDPPEDPEGLEAYGVPFGADVVPVRWSLTRAPEGPPAALTPEARRLARQRYAALVAQVDRGRRALPGWELPAVPSFDPDQRFGPMTPLVLARAAQMTQAGPWTLSDLVLSAHAVVEAAGLSWPQVRARALGRPVGRNRALDELDDGVDELVHAWVGCPRPSARWRQLVEVFVTDQTDPLVAATVEWNLRDMLYRAVRCCLAGEVVADLADPELLLWAAGPWEAACSPDNRPGADWFAAAEVVARAREVLAGLPAHRLLELGALHHAGIARTADPDESPGLPWPVEDSESPYARLRNRLTAWALISAAGCPPATRLVAGLRQATDTQAATEAAGNGRSPVHEHSLWGLNDWLECVTSVLVHRARLSAAEVHTFCAPVAGLLPDMERLLNEPV